MAIKMKLYFSDFYITLLITNFIKIANSTATIPIKCSVVNIGFNAQFPEYIPLAVGLSVYDNVLVAAESQF